MNKHSKKSQSYNEDILNALSEKYGLSKVFIRASIRGDRTSATSETVKKEYNALLAETLKAIKKNIKSDNNNKQ